MRDTDTEAAIETAQKLLNKDYATKAERLKNADAARTILSRLTLRPFEVNENLDDLGLDSRKGNE